MAFARRFGDAIRSARIEGDDLKVETVNGSRFMCDAVTGELLKACSKKMTPVCRKCPAARLLLMELALTCTDQTIKQEKK